MGRIGELDLPARLAPGVPRVATMVGVALACSGTIILVRGVLAAALPGGAPFALIFPAMMVATLFARWISGALTALILIVHTWFFVYPVVNSFRFANAAGAFSVAMVSVAAVVTVLLAEMFRRAVRRAAAERDREVAERDLFLQEFDHRVKNNFALVASLLELQRRRAAEPATAEALGTALARVDSIARAHRHLYRGATAPGSIDMAEYLAELCAALSETLFLHAAITLDCQSDHAALLRDRAVSIGLVVNELVTNAVKHAFPGRDAGTIRVSFRAREEGGWRLSITDNGVGMSEQAQAHGRDGGLGRRLTEAFARQADGTLSIETGTQGTAVTLDLAP